MYFLFCFTSTAFLPISFDPIVARKKQMDAPILSLKPFFRNQTFMRPCVNFKLTPTRAESMVDNLHKSCRKHASNFNHGWKEKVIPCVSCFLQRKTTVKQSSVVHQLRSSESGAKPRLPIPRSVTTLHQNSFKLDHCLTNGISSIGKFGNAPRDKTNEELSVPQVSTNQSHGFSVQQALSSTLEMK
ncbi:hypothetical protein DNTS_011914 [Danionella cerebrum]|uniref:Uncharacterized protein n=1 Tax=Danionella cerebrum TaxID=2873325 RepID=A0A553Q7J2_9TELE|nr:hypothetical protein DNTS_011914 [Danionella translucida]